MGRTGAKQSLTFSHAFIDFSHELHSNILQKRLENAHVLVYYTSINYYKFFKFIDKIRNLYEDLTKAYTSPQRLICIFRYLLRINFKLSISSSLTYFIVLSLKFCTTYCMSNITFQLHDFRLFTYFEVFGLTKIGNQISVFSRQW